MVVTTAKHKNKDNAIPIKWNSPTDEEDQNTNSNESESENEWTDIFVTEQGGLNTKTRKIQDDLEEPNWDKKVDDVILENEDEPIWKKRSIKSSSSTDNLTQMKDWSKLYNPEAEEEKEESKIAKKKIPKRKSHPFGVNIDDNHHGWQIIFNIISSSRAKTVLCSILIPFLVYLYSKAHLQKTKENNLITISPITALTICHSSMALIPKYPNFKEINVYSKTNNNQLIHPLVLTRNIRHLKHLGIISDCATELYSVDSYLFIASCTFGILIFR